jgi:hypothetical protein
MLPGFRFLFVAVVLSMSTLVFGVGAAALLRSAHEEFVNLPGRRPPPEAVFAQRFESATPTLAMLRVDTPAPVAEPPNPVVTEPSLATPSMAVDVDKLGAPAPSVPAGQPLDAVERSSETPVEIEAQTSPQTPAAPIEERRSEAATIEIRVASIEQPPSVASPASPPESSSAVPPDDGASAAARKIATLGGPEVVIDSRTGTKAGSSNASSDKSAASAKQAQKRRIKRRRIVRVPPPPKPDTLGLFDPTPLGQPAVRRNPRPQAGPVATGVPVG